MHPRLSERVRTHTRTIDTALEIEGNRYKQNTQATTTVGLQLYFILIQKFNNAAHRPIINRCIYA